MKLRLTLDVDYDPQGTPEQDLREILEWNVKNAIGNGMLTGSTLADVNSWEIKVKRTDEG